eukprot:Protomagalhaensia_sp_Gyna_25__5294@NODE_65_length_5715_cov_10_441860_g48_i0_p4_GENE_NODE_65_length_5715_cov_10_441860_g48_i0NODE_65_length_5715_cov_10_441860_g48_i0_p4_ORF_typecomplete_len442_score44_37_NODE_65_length_5715_cov_10_441860_g48_i029734298
MDAGRWNKLLTEQRCKLYSLSTPPLCRAMRLKWTLYVISAVLKCGVGVALVAITIILLVKYENTENEALVNETLQKIAIYSSCFINSVIFMCSGVVDLGVFLVTPLDWPKLDPELTNYPIFTSKAFGNIVDEFFESRFAGSHRAQVLFNRVIATVSTTLCVICAIPRSSWRSTECPMAYRIKDYIMTPFPEDEEPVLADICTHSTTTLLTESIFWVQLGGVLTCHLTLHLWNSSQFTLYLLLGWVRFLLGVIIFSLASRYFASLYRFLSHSNDAYDALSVDIKAQVIVFLYTMMINGIAGGTFAYAGGAYSMFVTWRRSQYWLVLDLGVISVVGIVLFATFFSNYWLRLAHKFFCNFSYFYPNAKENPAEFADFLCRTMSFRFRLNYQYWLTFIAALIALVQLCWGLSLLSEAKGRRLIMRVHSLLSSIPWGMGHCASPFD